MNKISACLIVYNEAKLVGRCLESLEGIVDEIIVVHDGECADGTLEICRKFTDKIFVRPHAGAMEMHRPFCFREAAGEWILQIDADEYLSAELKTALRRFAGTDAAAYEFLWPLWDGEKYITRSWPYKICFFRKDKISFLAIPHFEILVQGRVARSQLRLEHRPGYDNYSWRVFKDKWLRWARLQAAAYLLPFFKIEKYNYNSETWPHVVSLRIKFPLLLAAPEFVLVFFRSLLAGAWREWPAGWRAALMFACYRTMVDYYIFILKSRKKDA